MKTILVPLVLVSLVCSGCAISPLVLYPKPAATASTAGMTIVDERKPIEPAPNLKKPLPDRASFIDFMTVLPNNARVADLVASIVATEFPGARVVLKKFDIGSGYLVYFNVANSQVVAEITPRGGQPFVIEADGRNPNWASGEKNLEIALDRALEDFTRKLRSVRGLAASRGEPRPE